MASRTSMRMLANSAALSASVVGLRPLFSARSISWQYDSSRNAPEVTRKQDSRRFGRGVLCLDSPHPGLCNLD